MKRYSKVLTIDFGARFATSYAIPIIRQNIANGNIRWTPYVLQGSERLDTLAGQFYLDSTLGWVIAAASLIGNPLGVTPGTMLKIPNLEDVSKFL
jgi:hypothetical protein